MNYDRSLYAQFHNTLQIDIDHIMLLDLAVLNQIHNFRQDFGNLSDPSIGNALEIHLYSDKRSSARAYYAQKLLVPKIDDPSLMTFFLRMITIVVTFSPSAPIGPSGCTTDISEDLDCGLIVRIFRFPIAIFRFSGNFIQSVLESIKLFVNDYFESKVCQFCSVNDIIIQLLFRNKIIFDFTMRINCLKYGCVRVSLHRSKWTVRGYSNITAYVIGSKSYQNSREIFSSSKSSHQVRMF